MGHFTGKAEHFQKNFWSLVQPNHPFVSRMAEEASHVRGLPESLIRVVEQIMGEFRYETDMNLWGQEDYWASAEEVMAVKAGDCDDLALFGSSVLFAMGIPHYFVIGHLRDQLRGLEATPEAAPGHVWLEVDDGDHTYILEFTCPEFFVIPRGAYATSPYVPVEYLLVQ